MKVLINEETITELSGLLTEISGKRMGAGVLPICEKTGRILIQKRGPKITSPNEWANWGGMSNKGETPTQCAKREFHEETGRKVYVRLIPSYVHRKSNLNFHNFIGIVKNEFEPKVNVKTVDGDIEASDYAWVTLVELTNWKKGKLHHGLKYLLRSNKNQIRNIIKNLEK